jgi:hypothetical protein
MGNSGLVPRPSFAMVDETGYLYGHTVRRPGDMDRGTNQTIAPALKKSPDPGARGAEENTCEPNR